MAERTRVLVVDKDVLEAKGHEVSTTLTKPLDMDRVLELIEGISQKVRKKG